MLTPTAKVSVAKSSLISPVVKIRSMTSFSVGSRPAW
jgi:hypothetical protein